MARPPNPQPLWAELVAAYLHRESSLERLQNALADYVDYLAFDGPSPDTLDGLNDAALDHKVVELLLNASQAFILEATGGVPREVLYDCTQEEHSEDVFHDYTEEDDGEWSSSDEKHREQGLVRCPHCHSVVTVQWLDCPFAASYSSQCDECARALIFTIDDVSIQTERRLTDVCS